MIPKQIPFYIETVISQEQEKQSIQIDIFDTNFNCLASTPLTNFSLRQYIQKNGLKWASITSQSVASLQGTFSDRNLDITQFNVDPKYRGLSLGKLLIGTAEDLAVSKNCENINFDIESICPKTILEAPDKTIAKFIKTYISNKVTNSFNKTNRSQLNSFLENHGFENNSLSRTPTRQYILQPNTMERPGEILQAGLKGFDIEEMFSDHTH